MRFVFLLLFTVVLFAMIWQTSEGGRRRPIRQGRPPKPCKAEGEKCNAFGDCCKGRVGFTKVTCHNNECRHRRCMSNDQECWKNSLFQENNLCKRGSQMNEINWTSIFSDFQKTPISVDENFRTLSGTDRSSLSRIRTCTYVQKGRNSSQLGQKHQFKKLLI